MQIDKQIEILKAEYLQRFANFLREKFPPHIPEEYELNQREEEEIDKFYLTKAELLYDDDYSLGQIKDSFRIIAILNELMLERPRFYRLYF